MTAVHLKKNNGQTRRQRKRIAKMHRKAIAQQNRMLAEMARAVRMEAEAKNRGHDSIADAIRADWRPRAPWWKRVLLWLTRRR